VATQRPSPLIAIARASLTVAVALGLLTVFRGNEWLPAAIFAAIAPHAIITYGERRRWSGFVTLGLVIVGAFVFTLYVVEPHTVSSGIPTSDSFHQYFDDLEHAPEILRKAVVPVEPAGGALMLALLAVWTVGAMSEWAARRLEASLGALGPSLVMFVAIAALGEGSWVPVTIVYALAAAGYLLVLHQSESTERRSWFHAARPHHSRVLSGGAIAAVAIVCAAALIGPLLPGAESGAWFDYRSLGEGDGPGVLKAKTPIVSIQAKLLSDPERQVFLVTTDKVLEARWRVIALDEYNGDLWTLRDTGKDADKLRDADAPESTRLVQKFQIFEADAHWLPAAYQPEEISLDEALVVQESATLYVRDESLLRNLRYEVVSAVPRIDDATVEKLRKLEPVVDEDLERYLELPDVPQSVKDEADRIVREAGATTPFEKGEALMHYFNDNAIGGFTYNQNVAQEETIESIEDFLFNKKEGYCEQFAASFGVMARYLGLPTRNAVGYTSGEPGANGTWLVRNKNAHAWPEVYFEGYGWLPFEPTPDRFEPVLGNGSPGTGPAQVPNNEETPPGETTTTPSTPTSVTPNSRPLPNEPNQPNVTLGGGEEKDDSVLHRIAVTALTLFLFAIVVGAILLAALVVLAWRRSHRRRNAPDPRDRVLGAWAEALEHLEDAGIEPRPSATSVEFAMRHAPAHGAGNAGPPLMELAQLQTEAMFAKDPPSNETADDAWAHVDDIDGALKKMISRTKRWRRRLDPRRVRETVEV